MKLNIITPEKIFFSAEAQMVTIPGAEGEFGVLEGHAPFLSALKPGVITIDLPDGGKCKLAVAGGFAEVVPEHCTVLAEAAVDCANITQADAQARLSEAKMALEDALTDVARHQAERNLALAEAVALAA